MAKPYHHGDLRRALLDETIEQIRRGWTSKLSLRSIAARVGVSPAAAYHHFTDKDALLDATVNDIGEMLYISMAQSMKLAPERQKSLALGLSYIDFAMNEPQLFGDLMSRECIEARNIQDASLDIVKQALLADGILEGHDDKESELIVYSAWAIVHGFATLVLSKKLSVDEAREAFRAYWQSQVKATA